MLSEIQTKILDKIKSVFETIALEGHIFGSMARGDFDEYSDIDIWITFKDEDIKEILDKRLEYYSQVGNIVHICEPPQNSPLRGIHSFVLYKIETRLIQVDFYLCPQSTSFITSESKTLFGNLNLPSGELTLNPQKINVSESYRIDFFITFIFIAIKNLIRNNPSALDQLFHEYEYLTERYNIQVKSITDKVNTFETLEKVIANIDKIANNKQKQALFEILNFIKQIK